jgi:hypothetical protein
MAEVRLLSAPDVERELVRLRELDLNFDPIDLSRLRRDPSWHVDHYRKELPSEPVGAPVDGGSWSVARHLSTEYEFVDPRIVHAYFDPREAFEDRTVLLDIRFWGLRIYSGVRIGGVDEGTRTEDARSARVSAWNYRTLAGHFERGQIDYEVWKWLDTGEVEFRIDAVSQAARGSHPLVDVGFRIFGRGRQRKFARNACERMARLTREALDQAGGGVLAARASSVSPPSPIAIRPTQTR